MLVEPILNQSEGFRALTTDKNGSTVHFVSKTALLRNGAVEKSGVIYLCGNSPTCKLKQQAELDRTLMIFSLLSVKNPVYEANPCNEDTFQAVHLSAAARSFFQS